MSFTILLKYIKWKQTNRVVIVSKKAIFEIQNRRNYLNRIKLVNLLIQVKLKFVTILKLLGAFICNNELHKMQSNKLNRKKNCANCDRSVIDRSK